MQMVWGGAPQAGSKVKNAPQQQSDAQSGRLKHARPSGSGPVQSGTVVDVVVVAIAIVVVVGHGPQSSVPPQPSATVPHDVPHVRTVQQMPNGFEPGGAPLMHRALQQL